MGGGYNACGSYDTKDGMVWCVNQGKLSSIRDVKNGTQRVYVECFLEEALRSLQKRNTS